MFYPRVHIRFGLVSILLVFGGMHLYAFADEITSVTTNGHGVQIELMGSKPVYSIKRFSHGEDRYFLLSFSHAVLLGAPRVRLSLPTSQSTEVTAAQFSDRPYVVHLLVRNQGVAHYHVSTLHQHGPRYLVSVVVTKLLKHKVSFSPPREGHAPEERAYGPRPVV